MPREQANEPNNQRPLDLESGRQQAAMVSGQTATNNSNTSSIIPAIELQATGRRKTSSGSQLADGCESSSDLSLSWSLDNRQPQAEQAGQRASDGGPATSLLAAPSTGHQEPPDGRRRGAPSSSTSKIAPPPYRSTTDAERHAGRPAPRARRRAGDRFQVFINPSGKVCYWWSAAVSLAFLYNFWCASFRFAFHEIDAANWPVWLSLDQLADLIYWADIFLNHKTGYLLDGVLQRNPKKISDHYRDSTQFHLDALCILPLDILYLSFGFYSILRCNRLVKIYKFWSFVERTERHTNYPNAFRVCTLVHNILLIFHWNACIFQLISANTELIGTDQLLRIEEAQCSDVACKYLHAFYWSTLAISGNLPAPRRRAEYVFVIVELIFGFILFAWVLGHVANIVTNVSAARKEFQARLDAVKTYMRTRHVSMDLQTKVIRWFDYLWSSQMTSDEDRSVACLPDRLKAEIAIHVNLDTLKRVDIFQDTEVGFLRELVLRLKPVLFSPGDYVCRKDEAGHEMYIVSKGRLEVVTEAEEETRVVATFTAGSYFGEIAVLNVGAAGNKRTASVRSVGYSDLFCLSKQDLWDVLKDYPQAEARIRAVAEERLTALGGGPGPGRRARSGSRRRTHSSQHVDSTGSRARQQRPSRRRSQRSRRSRVQQATERPLPPRGPMACGLHADGSVALPRSGSRRQLARLSAGSQRMALASSGATELPSRKCPSSRTMEPIQQSSRPPVVVPSASGCARGRQTCRKQAHSNLDHNQQQLHQQHQQHCRHRSTTSVACFNYSQADQDEDEQDQARYLAALPVGASARRQQQDTLSVFSASMSPRELAAAAPASSQSSTRGQRLLVQPGLHALGQSRSFECSPQGDASNASRPSESILPIHRDRSGARAPSPPPLSADEHPHYTPAVQLHVTTSSLGDQVLDHGDGREHNEPASELSSRRGHHPCLHERPWNSLASPGWPSQLRTRSSSVTTRPAGAGDKQLLAYGELLEHQLSLDECRIDGNSGASCEEVGDHDDVSSVCYGRLAGWSSGRLQLQQGLGHLSGARLRRHRADCRRITQPRDFPPSSSSSGGGPPYAQAQHSARTEPLLGLMQEEQRRRRQQQVASPESHYGQEAQAWTSLTQQEPQTPTCRIEIEPERVIRKKRSSDL